MIPKIIHYCWFGGKSLPDLAVKCISSWKKFFPDYEIKEWNESNYDVHKIPYIDEAYKVKKYAFVSDYARFDILYGYGGIYFDIDVEVVKSFDDILKYESFMGFSSLRGYVASGLGMGCIAGLDIVYQILEFYLSLQFSNTDGSYNLHTVVEYTTTILKKNGLKQKNVIQNVKGLTIFPVEYFGANILKTGELGITKNTHSLHHDYGSWLSDSEKKWRDFRKKYIKIYGHIAGTVFSLIYFFYICIKNNELNIFMKNMKEIIHARLSPNDI